MTEHQPPTYVDLLWPTLRALEDLGGSASIQELSEQIASALALSDETLAVPHKEGPETEVDYRAAWARTHLKYVGEIDNPSRGIWTITEIGRQIRTGKEARERVRQYRLKKNKGKQTRSVESDAESDVDGINEQDWKDNLLNIIRGIQPNAFERLCQRVLRESGFIKVEVTGRSGDGGIDGAGVLRVNLLSFHVRFQCKRYTGSVGAPAIRDFRGAMVGRADKGLFITTGGFTTEAKREAVRDGAPAIDLIDGITLCDLLKERNLGVTITTIEQVAPQPEFFDNL